MARNSSIDALRGLAIAGVVEGHLLSRTGAFTALGLPQVVCDLFDFGWAGVDLFFVLSAYLLTTNLLRHHDRPGVAAAFYKRRALRILPLYWTLLLAGFLLHAAWRANGGTDNLALWFNAYPLWVYVAFLQNWVAGLDVAWVAYFYAPTWSLAVEEHFYLILPALVLWLPVRRLALVAGGAILTAPLIRFGLDAAVNSNASYAWSIARIDAFGWGVVLALAPRLWPGLMTSRRADNAGRAAVTLAIAMACVAPMIGLPDARHLPNAISLTLTALIAAGAAFAAIGPRQSATPGPLKSALIWCGERCFSLYLWHMPVLGLVFLAAGATQPQAGSADGIILALLAGAATLALSDLTYRFIEQPFMALAERVAPYAPSASPHRSIATAA